MNMLKDLVKTTLK